MLRRELMTIVDARTGGPLVASVQRTRDLYTGEWLDALPDVLVEWSATPTGSLAHAGGRGATVRAVSPRIAEVVGSNAYVRTGEHVPTGMFLWTGPGVPAKERSPVSVMDFHPTLCHLLGVPAPGVDGRILVELRAVLSLLSRLHAGRGGSPDTHFTRGALLHGSCLFGKRSSRARPDPTI
jgi:hypothetical protein